MQRVLLFAGLLSLLLPAGFAGAADLDLRQAERLALERNLGMRAQTLNARAGQARVGQGYGLYDPQLGVRFADGESRDQLNLQFFSAPSTLRYRQLDVSLTQQLPSGGALAAVWTNRRDDTRTLPEPEIDPAYGSEARLSLVQPLLEGFGRTVTEQQILFAVGEAGIALQELRAAALQTLAQVRRDWFEVIRLRENLTYRQASLEVADEILGENRRRLETGVLAPVEVLEAEVGKAQRERDLLDARRDYDDARDRLAVRLDLEAPVEVRGDFGPVPAIEEDEDAGVRYGLQRHPELLRQQLAIGNLALREEVEGNRLLPSLDLDASYAHKGLGKDYGDDLDQLGRDDLRNWQVGLSLSVPLGNREARGALAESRLERRRGQVLLRQLQTELRRQVRAAMRRVEVSRKKVEVTTREVALSEEKLRILLARQEVGLSTTREVLEGETDLAGSRTAHSAARADYHGAVTDYLQVTGRLLETEGVVFAGAASTEDEKPLLRMP